MQSFFISDRHRCSDSQLEVWLRLVRGGRKLMTTVAVRLQWFDPKLRTVTTEAGLVIIRKCFERSLLQPKRIVQVFWWLSYVLVRRLPLRLIRLMTNGAALWFSGLFWFLLPRSIHQRNGVALSFRQIDADRIEMFIVRKSDYELGAKIFFLLRRSGNVPKTGEQEARSVAWSNIHMTIRTDRRSWSLSREELLPVTV